MINISDTQQLKTSVTYYGTGSQTNFDFPFDYLRKAFIHVTINDVEVSDYSIDSRTIIFETAPSEGAIINIYRSTDTTRLVAWADASVLKASDMTISQVQQLHILEEGQDWSKLNSIYLDETDNAWQGNNHTIKNISDPVNDKDVVTKGYMENVQGGFILVNTALKDEATKQADIATTKANEASASASAAKTSETNAASSETLVKRWAEASDSPNGTTSKSAKTWAGEAANSASAAKTSETNAKSSETKAANSADSASSSASTATTKATAASNAATAAKTSETNAKNSETRAAATVVELNNTKNTAISSIQQLTNQCLETGRVATEQADKAENEAAKAKVYAETIPIINPYFAASYYKHLNPITIESQNTLKIPKGLMVAINGIIYTSTKDNILDVSAIPNREGKDVYIYACQPSNGDEPVFVLSLNSTVPTNYTADTSRKIGGFHCLCVAVGTISGHALSGYVAGDILPRSLWDLLDRPESDPEGMVKGLYSDTWFDIYLSSWDGTKLVSTYGGVIADGGSSKKWHGEACLEQYIKQKKRLPWRHEFQMEAKGSNEETNIAGSSDPNTTGGHKDTSSRRMISDIGLEDACGVMWQWAMDLGFAGGSGWTESVYNSAVDSKQYGQTYGTLFRLLLGGGWDDGANCGSRCAFCDASSANVYAGYGSRGSSEPRKVQLS